MKITLFLSIFRKWFRVVSENRKRVVSESDLEWVLTKLTGREGIGVF